MSDAESSDAAISDDGRFVVYVSKASLAYSTYGQDVFVRDRRIGRTRLVSRATGILGTDDAGTATEPDISGDARYVAFATDGRLSPSEDSDAISDVYVRDAQLVVPDSDGDDIVDSVDRCPNENSNARDRNTNGCLDYPRINVFWRFVPGTYFRRRADGSVQLLGVSVKSIFGKDLPERARVELTCSRRACPKQRLTPDRRTYVVSFKRMRKRKLRTGVRVTIRATAPGFVGDGIEYTIRPNRLRRRDFCMRPGSKREGSCDTTR